MQKNVLLSLYLGCLIFAVVQTHWLVKRALPPSKPDAQSRILLPDPNALKALSLGYDKLLADCFWLAFIQYIGDTAARRIDHYSSATDFLDLIISLDPTLTESYSLAAFIVGAEMRRPDLADKLIQKGFSTNPNDWYIPLIAGANQYLYAHNDKAAANYYRLASKYPGAPNWLARQADILEHEIPSIIKQINVLESIYRSNEAGPVKERAKEGLIKLWLKVMQESPTPLIKARAKQQLSEYGVIFSD